VKTHRLFNFLGYADYIINRCYPEAQKLLREIGGDKFMLLQVGSQGLQVGQLQAKLNEIGFNCGRVDKIFGPTGSFRRI